MPPKRVGIKNRVSGVGVELEGGWYTNDLPPGTQVEHDGSVAITFPKRKTMNDPQGVAGEIPSPPLQVDTMPTFVKKFYPKFVNETCGMHVHLSFAHRLNYQRLLTPDYTKAMIAGLLSWAEKKEYKKDHPIWARLEDPNHRHCAHIYLGDHQVHVARKDYNSRGKQHSRYTAINYCYKQHGTLECRLLPMFETADEAVEAVQEIINITNRFLAKQRQRELKHGMTVKVSDAVTKTLKAYI